MIENGISFEATILNKMTLSITLHNTTVSITTLNQSSQRDIMLSNIMLSVANKTVMLSVT
jgi:hypothetical protein